MPAMFGLFSKKKKPAAEPAKKKADAKAKAPAPEAKAKAKPVEAKAVEKKPAEAKVSAGAKLDAAKEALAKQPPMSQNRKKLIAQALAVQATQAKALDKLDPEMRNKLQALALKTLVIDPMKKKLH
jgi:hypothetical protein